MIKKNNKDASQDLNPETPDVEPISPVEPLSDRVSASKPKQKMKPRQGLGEELIGVYESSGDDFRNLNALEHQSRKWQRMLVWILTLLITAFVSVAGLYWYMWGRQPRFNAENVVFEITAPEKITSGQAVTYAIRYANREPVDFRKSELELRYPAGFQFVSAEPEPRSGDNLWDLGALGSFKEGTIEVQGYLVGKPDIESTISGVFRYWPANFSSEFSEVASAQTEMEAANIEIRLDGPEQVLAGQKTSYTVVYNNPGTETINDLRIEVIYPAGFVVESTKPELDEQNSFLDLAELPVNEERELQIEGYYSAAPDQPVDFIVELSQKGGDTEYFVQKELKQATTVIRGDLVVNVIANGSNRDASLGWGDTVHTSIAYQNNSETDLSDLRVIATLESRYRTNTSSKVGQGALDWSTLVDSARGALKELKAVDDKTLRSRSITWTAEDLDDLETLTPDQEGTIDFQIDLYDLAQAKKNLSFPEDVELILTVEVTVGQTGGVTEQLKVIGNPIRFAINSDLLLDSEARYFDQDGNQVGNGPLPPVVDQKTQYRVYWTMTNSLHEVQDVLVSTDLPDNVSWVNSFEVSAGEVIYNANNNSLTWRLNRIPLDVKTVTLSYDVAVTPVASQAGSTAQLTKKITLTAVDSSTGGKIIQAVSPLTTGVEKDDQASDKGVVTK
jgi:hypothetical protein